MNVQYFVLLFCLTITTVIQISNCEKNYHHRRNSHRQGVNHENYTRKRRTNDENVAQINENSIDEETNQRPDITHEVDDIDEMSSYSSSEDRYYRGRKRSRLNRIHRYDDHSGSFESYELPLPPRKARFEYAAENRPLFNLLLGILDTFKTSTKQEIRRAEERKRRTQSQLIIDNIGDHVKNLTAVLLTPVNV